MPAFKRASLEPGTLADLIDALHQLHSVSHHPSTRDLQRDIGGRDAASHAAIHKVFTGSRLPTWRLVEPLVQAMARRAGRDERAEVERISILWRKAADQGTTSVKPQTVISSEITDSDTAANQFSFSQPLSALLPDALNELEAVGLSRTAVAFRIPTGLDDLDLLIGGWSQGCLIVVGGRPGSGKTNLLLNFCREATIRYGLTTMFVTGEMNSREIQTRILSAEARVPLHILRTGQMSDDDWSRVARRMSEVADAPLFIATPPDCDMELFIADASNLHRKHGLKLLVIDSLQWMIEGEATPQTVERDLRRLKKFAEATKISIIVSAHAASPVVGSLPVEAFSNSAAIEQAADVVILLDRLDQDDRESPYAGEANLIVAKNRNGPTATISIACQLHYCRFVDLMPGAGAHVTATPAKDLDSAWEA